MILHISYNNPWLFKGGISYLVMIYLIFGRLIAYPHGWTNGHILENFLRFSRGGLLLMRNKNIFIVFVVDWMTHTLWPCLSFNLVLRRTNHMANIVVLIGKHIIISVILIDSIHFLETNFVIFILVNKIFSFI